VQLTMTSYILAGVTTGRFWSCASMHGFLQAARCQKPASKCRFAGGATICS